MRLTWIFLLAAIAFLSFTYAVKVEILVLEKLSGKLVFSNYTAENSVVNATAEFYNDGSVPYKARLRLEISGERNSSVWSDERIMMPGERENFMLRWFLKNSTPNVTARLRVYYAGEILNDRETALETASTASGTLEISNVRTFEDRIEFDVSNATGGITATAIKYPASWVFEESTITKPGKAVIPYIAPVWSPETITIAAFSQDGSSYAERTAKLEKPGMFIEFLLAFFFV